MADIEARVKDIIINELGVEAEKVTSSGASPSSGVAEMTAIGAAFPGVGGTHAAATRPSAPTKHRSVQRTCRIACSPSCVDRPRPGRPRESGGRRGAPQGAEVPPGGLAPPVPGSSCGPPEGGGAPPLAESDTGGRSVPHPAARASVSAKSPTPTLRDRSTPRKVAERSFSAT